MLIAFRYCSSAAESCFFVLPEKNTFRWKWSDAKSGLKMSEQQPVSPKKVWKTFKNPGELLVKTTLKKLQKRQAQWKENILTWGLAQDFCTALYVCTFYQKARQQQLFWCYSSASYCIIKMFEFLIQSKTEYHISFAG